MSKRFTEEQVLQSIARLDRAQLAAFIEAGMVRPLHGEGGPLFREVDLARLGLMCDLCETFELDEDALCMVMSLLDQLHQIRREMRIVLEVVAEDGSDELRRQIGRALRRAARP